MRTRWSGCVWLALTTALLGCESEPFGVDLGEDVVWLTIETEGDGATALFEGTITLDAAGCLRMHADVAEPGHPGYNAVWPDDAYYEVDGARVRFFHGDGRSIGATGDRFRLGGGIVPPDFPIGDRKSEVQTRCPGEYWFVSSQSMDAAAG